MHMALCMKKVCRVTKHRVTKHRVTKHRVTKHRVTKLRVTKHRVTKHRVTNHCTESLVSLCSARVQLTIPGLVIAVVRGYTPPDTIARAYSKEKVLAGSYARYAMIHCLCSSLPD